MGFQIYDGASGIYAFLDAHGINHLELFAGRDVVGLVGHHAGDRTASAFPRLFHEQLQFLLASRPNYARSKRKCRKASGGKLRRLEGKHKALQDYRA
jgi:hypothetical protein